MGFASIVATALGIILLIVTAYVLVSGVLVASETVVAAQKDMTAIQVEMLGTSLNVTYLEPNIIIENNGNEPIRDFDKLDVYVVDTSSGPTLYRYPSDWTIINPPPTKKQLNPGEEMKISLIDYNSTVSSIKIVTPNGVPACWP